MAFPTPAQEEEEIANHQPIVTASIPLNDLQQLVDKKSQTEVLFPDKTREVQIDVTLAKPFTARSLVLYPAATPFHATVVLQAGDGNNFTTISEFDLNCGATRSSMWALFPLRRYLLHCVHRPQKYSVYCLPIFAAKRIGGNKDGRCTGSGSL